MISYLGLPNTLKVAKCVNEACTGTSTITTVDPATGTNNIFSSIVIGADGFPVISYGDSGGKLEPGSMGRPESCGLSLVLVWVMGLTQNCHEARLQRRVSSFTT